MAATRCIKCTKPLDTGGQYCDECKPNEPVILRGAASTIPAVSVCPSCRRVLDSGTKFCVYCDHQARAELVYGGFLPRLGAFIIDRLILGAFGAIVGFATDSPQNAGLVYLAASLVYYVGFWVAEGSTPGKKVFGLRVASVDGEPIEIWQGGLRVFGYWVNSLTFGIGYLMVAFTAEKRGLHDFIANTIVVKEQRQTVSPEPS